MGLRIAQTVAEIGAEASGPSYSVPRLARALADRGNDVSFHTLVCKSSPSIPGVEVIEYPRLRFGERFGLSSAMARGLRGAAHRSDILHNHGLWMAPNVAAGAAVFHARAKFVISPRGVFAEAAMARSRRRKRILWLLGQGASVRAAALIHATSDAEADDIRRAGITAPIVVIANGVDLPADVSRSHQSPNRSRTLLFLGRLHPIKGIDGLLRAWAKLEPDFPMWNLSLVGPDEGKYESHLRALAQQLRLMRVQFDGPRFGASKFQAYADADLYVLPTHTENFGMSVAEALATGLPAVVTVGAPWRGLASERCGWWIEHGDAALEHALRDAMSIGEVELRAMGDRGRAWMRRDFAWGGVAQKMDASYRWILGQGDRPDCVR